MLGNVPAAFIIFLLDISFSQIFNVTQPMETYETMPGNTLSRAKRSFGHFPAFLHDIAQEVSMLTVFGHFQSPLQCHLLQSVSPTL
jgi:hypothetical protein